MGVLEELFGVRGQVAIVTGGHVRAWLRVRVMAARILANQNERCRAHDFCHGVTISSGGKDEWHRGDGPRNPDRDGSAGRE
jgi:hypothetical protein